MNLINYDVYTKLGKKEIYLPKNIYDKAYKYIEPRGLLASESEYHRPIENRLIEKIGYILEHFNIPLTAKISLENCVFDGYGYDIDIMADGNKKLRLESFTKIEIKGKTYIKFTIRDGKHEGCYFMSVKDKIIEKRKRVIGPITYIQNYTSLEEKLTQAFFYIKIPNTNQELKIEVGYLKMDDATLSVKGIENIISILSEITLEPDWQKEYTLLDIANILNRYTPIFEAKFVVFELRNDIHKTDIKCNLRVSYGNINNYKLDLFSSDNEIIELKPEMETNRTGTKKNKVYTYKKDVYVYDVTKYLKVGTLAVSRDELGMIKTELKPQEDISKELVDLYISDNFEIELLNSLRLIANYIKQTKNFADLKSHKLGISTNIRDIIEHLGKDEYGVCIIDSKQLIYASPQDQLLEVNNHNQLVETILKEAYPCCNVKEKKSKCIIVQFYKGSYEVRSNDISLILPNSFEIGNRQLSGLLILLENLKYAKYLGTRMIECNKLNNVKHSVNDIYNFIEMLSTQGHYDQNSHIPPDPLGIPLDELFKIYPEPYQKKLMIATNI